jgi:hypothetical protein
MLSSMDELSDSVATGSSTRQSIGTLPKFLRVVLTTMLSPDMLPVVARFVASKDGYDEPGT